MQQSAVGQFLSKVLAYGFVRFLIVGGSSYLVVTGITVGLHELLGVSERISAAFGLLCAFCINFFSIRFFVFSSQSPAASQIGKFAISSLLFRIFEYVGFSVLFGMGVHYIIALTITMIIGTISKYFLYKTVVFK